MKKITLCIVALGMSLAFYPLQSNAVTSKKVDPTTQVVSKTAEVKALELRLTQIDNLDKSALKASEKKALRKEVRSIKQQLKEMGGYVYVSVGAAVLIILLLIILL